jgi:biphenyl-2,3-diol 1,2-dioxygenase
MASVTQLGYVGLSVSNPAEWENFAVEILGLQPIAADGSGSLFLRMDDYHHRFILSEGGDDDLACVGWQVPDQGALREIADRLKSAGVEVTPGTRQEAEARRVVELLKFKDPSGIPTELHYGPLIGSRDPFRSPRTISGFVTGEMGLGHIVVRVNDSQESVRFYRDVLGMRVSDFIELKMRRGGAMVRLTFMHCNRRHHSIAFGEIPMAKRLAHFMLQLKSVDDVGATYYLCQDKGVKITGTIGRHTNDRMLSFYMASPSGFEIEYGWGGRLVDDRTWQVQTHPAPSVWGHRAGPG